MLLEYPVWEVMVIRWLSHSCSNRKTFLMLFTPWIHTAGRHTHRIRVTATLKDAAEYLPVFEEPLKTHLLKEYRTDFAVFVLNAEIITILVFLIHELLCNLLFLEDLADL